MSRGFGDDESLAAPLNPDYDPEAYSTDVPVFVRRNLARLDEHRIDYDLLEALLGHIDATSEPGAVLVFLPGACVGRVCICMCVGGGGACVCVCWACVRGPRMCACSKRNCSPSRRVCVCVCVCVHGPRMCACECVCVCVHRSAEQHAQQVTVCKTAPTVARAYRRSAL